MKPGRLVRYILPDGSSHPLESKLVQEQRHGTVWLVGQPGEVEAALPRLRVEALQMANPQSEQKSAGTTRKVETLSRNGFGLPIVTLEPNRGRVVYDYDEGNNVVRETVEHGPDIERSFDELSRLTRLVRFGQSEYEEVSFRYDECRNGIGRLCQILRPNGIITFHYDNYSRLDRVDVQQISPATLTSYEPDARLKERNSRNRVIDVIRLVWPETAQGMTSGPMDAHSATASVVVANNIVLSSKHAETVLGGFPLVSIRSRELPPHEQSEMPFLEEPVNEPKSALRKRFAEWSVGTPKIDAISSVAASQSSGDIVNAYMSSDCSGTPTLLPLDQAVRAGYRSYWLYAATISIGGIIIADVYVCMAIDEDTPIEPPDTRSTPPGDCTWVKHRQLQNDVDYRCDQVRRCSFADTCQSLRDKVGIMANRVGARNRINTTCFRGGNPGHKTAIQNTVRAQNRCYEHIDRVCDDD